MSQTLEQIVEAHCKWAAAQIVKMQSGTLTHEEVLQLTAEAKIRGQQVIQDAKASEPELLATLDR
jgi:hypothetical protein